MNLAHWLDGGTLLGAVRENGGLLAWEDDVDISVYLDNNTTWRSFAAGFTKRGARDGYTVEDFEKRGYLSISYHSPRHWPFHWERNRTRGEIRLDLVVFRLVSKLRRIGARTTTQERRDAFDRKRRLWCCLGTWYCQYPRLTFSAVRWSAPTNPMPIYVFFMGITISPTTLILPLPQPGLDKVWITRTTCLCVDTVTYIKSQSV